ncbi:phage protein [Buttiauxella brennerae ATCC 51605]|uniref:Phage protein n=1 Tax=Buttiauxella brennerae ATCC 51605 TaxID=1354251 RepID=A0A1B7IQT9_9ENTR|nr:DUF2732 family protein [Buttiauxella brennerae]OAT32099.1 phage protein [Buttiauxella brennerae ATCC 51605]
MQNIEKRNFETDQSALVSLLNKAKSEYRKDIALATSIRMEALAVHILNKEMTAVEAAELLRGEAVRYANESKELH